MAVFRWITILLGLTGGGGMSKVTAKMYLMEKGYGLVNY
jgi:hypothetical protein